MLQQMRTFTKSWVANLFLGRETVHGGVWRRLGVLDRRAMRRRAREELAALEVNVPRLTGVPIAHLSGGQRQAVAVARAAFWARRAMLMDEPTAALGVRESTQVLKLARSIADAKIRALVAGRDLFESRPAIDERLAPRAPGRTA